MAGPIQSGAVYRLTPKSASQLRLELSNGDPANGTQAQGWGEQDDYAFYNQVWLLTKSPQGWWRFVNLRSGTNLDLSTGSSANGTKIQGWATYDNDNQKWFITDAGNGYWKIANKGTGTVVDLAGGGTASGTHVQGWQDIPNDNQKWSFERVSRTPDEIQAVLTANPLTAPTQFKHYADANYLLLPKRVRDAIYRASGIRNNFRWRSEVFDCDDFAFTFKAAVAKDGNDWIRANNAFQAAMLEFKTNLNNDELYAKLLAVTSIDDVYDLTDKLQADQGRKGHLRHLAKVEPYLNRLREYTGAIDTFVQVYPEIMGLIWGPTKLLLQWSSVLAQSFDAILNTTADIGLLLPEFQEVAVLFSQNVRIYDVLVLFFKDILDFYQIGLKFFTMPRWKYFFEALWPRKKEHINLVKTHIERHALLMRNEVRLEHIREEHDARLRAFEHFKNAEKSDRLQQFYAIKADMGPMTYDDKLNWYHSRVCEGTGTWLFQDDVVKDWLDVSGGSSRVLWLQGIPGAGKTFLAGGMVDKAYTIGHTAFAFLSHAFSSSTSALSVLHSLLFQLAAQHEDLQDVLCHSTKEQIKSNVTVAVDTLKAVLDCAGHVFLIIDGLDEIDVIERRVLLEKLLHLSHECHEIRILISSRREEDITEILKGSAEMVRVDGRNDESIHSFVDDQLKQIFHSRRFPPQIQDEIKRSLAPLASKAKGMFLYAKVVLSGIELIDDVAEICEQMSILPEDLDDAYSRVLVRIDKLRPPSAREKARRILTWVGSSPTPLTVQEIEQALTVKPGSHELEKKVFASPNFYRLCGPIIEIVDGYVQFVHFTVKKYLFSPSINGHINLGHATLDLAVRCITFLSQRHYDVDTLDDDDGFTSLLLDGSYRLHYFAANGWFELVKMYLQVAQNTPLPVQLVQCLNSLMVKRSNYEFAAERDTSIKPAYLQPVETEYADLYEFLLSIAQFHERCSQTWYHINEGKEWISLDPLSIFHVSAKIYRELDSKLCHSSCHQQRCPCDSIEQNFGKRPFKCGFLNCSFQQHGFESRAQRAKHEKEHTRAWKCSFSGCEYEKIGFLSSSMRDQHLEKAHRDKAPPRKLPKGTSGQGALRALVLDLVRDDEVGMVERLLPRVRYDSWLGFAEDLGWSVGEAGSAPMAQMIMRNLKVGEKPTFLDHLYHGATKTGNVEFIDWLINTGHSPRLPEYHHYLFFHHLMGSHIAAFLKTDSEEMWRLCERYIADALAADNALSVPKRLSHVYLEDCVINATGRIAKREELLLSLWESVVGIKKLDVAKLSSSLGVVARTTSLFHSMYGFLV
ncbi:hypothetical protein CNMCM5793_008519 [Aspergillus hiratsukae]|uniref:NACHT domain-containing protein n=1 Tax=Aspergillus hiratsukae TaxID=1194566 RepID=A0A8H6P7Q8_9EURO|nr:hypothetical protein CNMCM5793_008519 [Aspergillus hiratsukae]